MIQTISMSAAAVPNIPDAERIRQEARERIDQLLSVLHDPDAPAWLKQAAELEMPGLLRLAGIRIPGDREAQ
jgi:hypothetical protein